jgi:hypothetical protein
MIDNEQARKSKKKQTKLEVTFDENDDLHQQVEVLSSGRKAFKFVKKVMDAAEYAVRSYAYHDWAKRFLETGRAPEIREFQSKATTVDVTQQNKAKLSPKKLAALDGMGVDVSEYVENVQTQIDMKAAADRGITDIILEALDEALSADDFEAVISQSSTLGPKFFADLPDIAKKSLRHEETVLGKMEKVLGILRPVVQFLRPQSDLSEVEAYELAHEFAHISASTPTKNVKAKTVPVSELDSDDLTAQRHLEE